MAAAAPHFPGTFHFLNSNTCIIMPSATIITAIAAVCGTNQPDCLLLRLLIARADDIPEAEVGLSIAMSLT
jgi:hypothetical protein